MKGMSFRRESLCAGIVALMLASTLAMGSSAGFAQEPTEPPKVEKKLTGRLPTYYGEVVSKEQRTKIYEIQAKFAEQLKKLREQIDALEQQQMAEVEGVLSPEQREQVAKRVAEAKAKRMKRDSAPPAETGGGSGGTAAAPGQG